MAEVRFTNAAEADLVDIDEFSAARFGEKAGEAYMKGFERAFGKLSDFPLIGHTLPEVGADIGAMTHKSHRIFYRVRDDAVMVLRILHHARDVPSVFEERS